MQTNYFIVIAAIGNNIIVKITLLIKYNFAIAIAKISKNIKTFKIILLLGHIASKCQNKSAN